MPFFAWQELVLARPSEFEDDFWLYEYVLILMCPMLCVLLVRSSVVVDRERSARVRPLSADAHRRHILVYASCVLSLEGVGLVTLLKYMLQLIN